MKNVRRFFFFGRVGGLLRFFGYSDVEAELDEWGRHFGNESTPRWRVHGIANIFYINADFLIFPKSRVENPNILGSTAHNQVFPRMGNLCFERLIPKS